MALCCDAEGAPRLHLSSGFAACRSGFRVQPSREAMANTFGKLFTISTWGESHGAAVGVVIDGCPPRLPLAESDVQADLDRRRPGQSDIVSPRKEKDTVEILSGVFEGKTTGAPAAARRAKRSGAWPRAPSRGRSFP